MKSQVRRFGGHAIHLPANVTVAGCGALLGILLWYDHRCGAHTGAGHGRHIAHQARLAVGVAAAQLAQLTAVGEQTVADHCAGKIQSNGLGISQCMNISIHE